ncbi:MAG: CBS domain-containing protein [Hyphococcus sp.]
MKVENILQSKGSDVFSVQADDSINSAVSVLKDKNIGAVVVQDGARGVVGILSERDIVRHLGGKGASALSMRVSDCMTPDPITCEIDETVDDLMGKMTENRIRHMPVTQQGQIVGIVSIGDVVKRKIEQAEQEAAALKEYIAS